MKQFKLFIILAVLVLAAALVSAQDFDFTSEEVDIDILPGQTALYNVTIFNYQDAADRFQLTGDVSTVLMWDVSTDTPIIEVAAGGSKEVVLELKPHLDVGLGPKQVILKLKSLNTEEIYRAGLPVYIGEGARFGTYVPNVDLSIDIDREIDPREKFGVNVCLKNKNLLNIKTLQVVLDGEIFAKGYETPLGPLESKCQEILFTLDENEPPAQHTVTAMATYQNETLATVVKNYEVAGYSTISEKSETATSLFLYTETITLFNDGNKEETQLVKREMPGFKRLFARSSPSYKVLRQDGISYVSWSITLGPNETEQIVFVRDYRWPLGVLVIIILAVILYFVFRSPMVLYKDAFVVGKEAEGVSDMKVKILVKNRTRSAVKNLRIIDKVPSIAEVVEKEHLGTMRPSKVIRHGKKGTIIKWDIEGFEPF